MYLPLPELFPKGIWVPQVPGYPNLVCWHWTVLSSLLQKALSGLHSSRSFAKWLWVPKLPGSACEVMGRRSVPQISTEESFSLQELHKRAVSHPSPLMQMRKFGYPHIATTFFGFHVRPLKWYNVVWLSRVLYLEWVSNIHSQLLSGFRKSHCSLLSGKPKRLLWAESPHPPEGEERDPCNKSVQFKEVHVTLE